jgi:dihydroflavonol-4-reductase
LTGISSFIRSSLARELRRGFEVWALVRLGCDIGNIDGLDMELIQGDLEDRHSLELGVWGWYVLFHVAAEYSFWVGDVDAMH